MSGREADRVGERRGERLVVAVGLLVAVTAGLAGGAFKTIDTQTVLYAVSSVGFVMATALLALRHAQRDELVVAAGFVVLTVAESLMWVNGRLGDPGYEAGFAGGAMFYVPGLLMLAIPAGYPVVVRLFAALSAGAWTIGSVRFLTGHMLSPDDPIALAGYALLSVAFVGAAIVCLRSKDVRASSTDLSPVVLSKPDAAIR